ncbi:MAG: DUF427 domain-containing protein [Parasphingorhabdus sp.]|uniref:DUF427 domain-containing protein n=1 Tax=Parasphingorhabdus sp. TaxID=2709688 RepID=UPI003298E862
MVTAKWNGAIVAQSDDTIMVEGNHYFPKESIGSAFFNASEKTSYCGWKGTASYFDLVVNGKTNKDAAWTYSEPLEAAAETKDRIAFWGGVEVTE